MAHGHALCRAGPAGAGAARPRVLPGAGRRRRAGVRLSRPARPARGWRVRRRGLIAAVRGALPGPAGALRLDGAQDRRSRRHAQRTRPGRPDERGARCAGRAGAVARHAGAAGLHRRRAGAGLVGPAPFAGADPPHRARAGRTRRVRPATHQGARAGRAGHAGAYAGRLHGAAGGKPGHAAPVHRRGRASAAHTAGRAARADGSGAGRGRPAEQRRSLLAVLRNAENCRGWSTSCSATPA